MSSEVSGKRKRKWDRSLRNGGIYRLSKDHAHAEDEAFIYAAEATGDHGRSIKIGMSVNPAQRVHGLSSDPKNPYRIVHLHACRVCDAPHIERLTHRLLSEKLISQEHFNVSRRRAIKAIIHAAELYRERFEEIRRTPFSHEISGRQIQEARQLMGISQYKLSSLLSINWATVVRAEKTEGLPPLRPQSLLRIKRKLEGLGIEFLPDGTVRLRPVRTAKNITSEQILIAVQRAIGAFHAPVIEPAGSKIAFHAFLRALPDGTTADDLHAWAARRLSK